MKAILLMAAMAIVTVSFAQTFPMQDGATEETCTGFFQDSGGINGEYGNNEDLTMTFCPVAPDSVLSVNFNLFNLGDGDQLTIYQGSGTSAPIGVFAGTEAQGQTFTSDPINYDGCLTFQFTSDGEDVGNFAGEISCGYPCIPPIADVETDQEGDTILVCIDEEIEFDGTGSTTAEDYEIESYVWDWGDNTVDSTGGLVQTHSFDSPGDYTVNLFITDENDCTNNNLTEVIVLVGTVPEFVGTTEDILACINEDVALELIGDVEPITWDGTPDIDFGGALFIPDDQSTCFESEVTYNSLISGAVVTDPSDIENIFINFEHSYMGDLNISIICPNNQTLLLHDGGGFGTYLGEPVDQDANLDPGVGYDYFWSPDATNGTWGEEAGDYTTLPSDTYAAAQDWSLLEGCPLNGTWTIQVCDELASDNGYIFDWAIEFDPSLFEDVISFTPEFGISCDSTFWTHEGEPVESGSENCNEITVNESVGGAYDYVFNATDNFGCTFEDTVTVNFIEPPEIEITFEEQDLLCDEEVDLAAEIVNENPLVESYIYAWDPGGLVSPDSALVTTASGYDTTTTFYFTVSPTNITNCVSQDSVTIVVDEIDQLSVDAEISAESTDCPGDPVDLTSVASGGVSEYGYQWIQLVGNSSDIASTDSAFTATPDINDLYTYIIQVTDFCDEMAFDTVMVEVNLPEPLNVADDELCVDESGILNISGGSGEYFLSSEFLNIPNPTEPNYSTSIPGMYEVFVEDDCQAVNPVTAVIDINSCTIRVPNIISPNGDGHNDALVFEGLLDYPRGSSLIVKNRWGKEVYSSADYQNDWSPTDLSEGTYYFILETTLDETIASYITLTR